MSKDHSSKQEGASSSTPSALKRWGISKLLNHVSNEKRMLKKRAKREAKRQKEARKHVVEYFHQMDDGYSHLANQALAKLKKCYDIAVIVHLVPALRDDNYPEPHLLAEMNRWDSLLIAPQYDLDFPDSGSRPKQKLVLLATNIMAALDNDQFADIGVSVSDCLWRGDEAGLQGLADKYGVATDMETTAKLRAGNNRRHFLKHFGGANYYYEGEWYWGVTRLYHLEERLRALGAARGNSPALIVPRPEVPSDFSEGAKDLTLEYFVSLRSPYTAVSWEPTLKLARDSGVKLVLRPVLPMVMRGVPATVMKGLYLWFDAAREARAIGVDFDKCYDPIGEPVKRAYSIYQWALGKGKGYDFFGAFLNAAFAKGLNTNSTSGLKQLVETAGLDWREAKQHLGDNSWQEEAEASRQAMYGFGNWGVPAYRLLDKNGQEILGAWGQDRLWLIAQKIQEHS